MEIEYFINAINFIQWKNKQKKAMKNSGMEFCSKYEKLLLLFNVDSSEHAEYPQHKDECFLLDLLLITLVDVSL